MLPDRRRSLLSFAGCASIFPSSLERHKVGAAHAVLAGDAFLAGSGKRIEIGDDFSALKTGVGKSREIAYRLQSTRDSANP
ncbi:MAG: hypothetical protein HZC24_01800 [Rhodocyclales bacterium]|nr:hypothetical protein [Rhodocyclales bacterium]